MYGIQACWPDARRESPFPPLVVETYEVGFDAMHAETNLATASVLDGNSLRIWHVHTIISVVPG